MAQYISKDALIEEIKKRISLFKKEKKVEKWSEEASQMNVVSLGARIAMLEEILSFLDTLKVKTDEENYLEKFKSLQHISGDLKSTLQDWGYAPNLYFFDGNWHVDWISCEEGDSIKDFEGNTPEEAIDKAYNWFHSTFCNN